MTPSLGNILIRAITALAILMSSPVFANSGVSNGAAKFPVGTPKSGDVYPLVSSPERGNVIYEGKVDSAGRQQVWSFVDVKDDQPRFRRGVIETDGSVSWENAFHSRKAGQNLYPNYSAARQALDQIPKSRSLVPTGIVVDQIRLGSGRSEVNSRYSEYLPEFDPANRPSNLNKVLEWNQAKSRQLGRLLKQVTTGKKNLVEVAPANPAEFKEAASKEPGKAANFSLTAIAFFAALGLGAAYTLMMDYPNNPMAYDSFLETLTDPVSYMALGGFVVGAHFFFKRMGGPGAKGKFIRQVPLFVGGLMAGSFISTAISQFAYDKDVNACWGFDNYRKTGAWVRDLEACDRAYDRWTSSPELVSQLTEVFAKWLPMAANLAITGAIFYGAATYVVNKYTLFRSLRQASALKQGVQVSKTPMPGVAKIVTAIVVMGAFMAGYSLVDTMIGIEQGLSEFMVAEQGLFSDPHGTSLRHAEKNLFTEWKRLKKNHWQGQYSWKNVCVDTNRSYQHIYNCDEPDQLDIEGVIDRYGVLTASWRKVKMQGTMSAYQQWMKKVDAFKSLLDAAYQFYKNAVEKVANGTFSAHDLKLSETALPLGMFRQTFDGPWKYVHTPKVDDFLLTSMACGPEVEGYGVGGWWDGTRQFFKSYLTFNTRPSEMIDDGSGEAIAYHPPRITVPLRGTQDTVCEHTTLTPLLWNPMDLIAPDSKAPPHKVNLSSEGKVYKGLVEYISENIRENILSKNGENRFEEWWSKHVMEEAIKIDDVMREDYRKMLEETLKPALIKDDYYWCDASQITGTGLERYMRMLSPQGEKCAPEALHRLGHGIYNSLRDEMRLYLAMVIDLYLSNLTMMATRARLKPRIPVVEISKAVLDQFDYMVKQMTVVDPKQRADMDKIKADMETHFNLLAYTVLGKGAKYMSPAKTVTFQGQEIEIEPVLPAQYRLAEKLLGKAATLFQDATNYYSIVTTFER